MPILHCDMDAFYCQVEQVRLNVPPDKPLAVQQWQGLIATNYPARAASITRHTPAPVAKHLCPDIQFVHVPTYKLGDVSWKHRDRNPRDECKVSLEVYRAASRRVFAILDRFGSVEKASIDEAYIQINPSNNDMAAYYDAESAVDQVLEGVAIGGHGDRERRGLIQASEDYEILWAVKVARDIRNAVYNELKYTISIGVSQTKIVSKLLSSQNKPDKISAVFSSTLLDYMGSVKFKKIGSMGGKFGHALIDKLGQSYEDVTCDQLMHFPKSKFEEIDAPEVYDIIRGTFETKVEEKSDLKSMLSAKSFNNRVIMKDEGIRWIELLCCELYERMRDEYEVTRRWPRSIVLQGQSRDGKAIMGGTITAGRISEASQLIKIVGKKCQWVNGITRLSLQCHNFTSDRDISDVFKQIPQSKKLKREDVHQDEPQPQKRLKSEPENEIQIADDGIPILDPLTVTEFPVLFKCKWCQTIIYDQDAHEHIDYHIALKLSSGSSAATSSAPSTTSVTSKTSKQTHLGKKSDLKSRGLRDIRDFFK